MILYPTRDGNSTLADFSTLGAAVTTSPGIVRSPAPGAGGCGCGSSTSTSTPAAASTFPLPRFDRRDRHDLFKMVVGGLITAFLVRAFARS